jgi:hypothetical protein
MAFDERLDALAHMRNASTTSPSWCTIERGLCSDPIRHSRAGRA